MNTQSLNIETQQSNCSFKINTSDLQAYLPTRNFTHKSYNIQLIKYISYIHTHTPNTGLS